MAEIISVGISEDQRRFRIRGGEARGRDQVYAAVTKWPGWSRAPAVAELGGRKVSVYTAPLAAPAALALANTAMQVHWEGDTRQAVERILERLRQARLCLERKMPPHAMPGRERVAMTHQAQAIEAILYLDGKVLLADDMGLGKSATSLWAAEQLAAERVLVLCPASVKYNWRNEIEKTLGRRAFVIDGTPKQRANIFADIVAAKNVDSWAAVIINYDLLVGLNDVHAGILASVVRDQVLICDESYYLKNRKSKRTKFVFEHLAPPKGGARYRMLLSGTPIRNMVDDLWSQVQIVQPGTWNGYWDFANRHLDTGRVDFRPPEKRKGTSTTAKVFGAKDVKGLNAIVNTIQIRRVKEDVLDLPPKIITFPELELVGDHKRVYKAMKDLALLVLQDLPKEMNIFHPQARSGVLAAMRCEQIAQGFCGGVPEPLVEKLGKVLSRHARPIPGRPREIMFPESPKVVWTTENLHTLFGTDKTPVMFSRFNAPLFWFNDYYTKQGLDIAFLHGALTSKRKHQIIDGFVEGDFDMMLCQVKMAEGFNLHNSQDCIFYGRDWSPAVNHQGEDRLHRIGQRGTVNIQIPIVRKTIETLIDRRLAAKDADAAQALKAITVEQLMEAL